MYSPSAYVSLIATDRYWLCFLFLTVPQFILSRTQPAQSIMSMLVAQNSAPPRSSTRSASWVQPIHAVVPDTLPCSAIENLCARVYIPPTIFFPLRPNEDPLQHFRHMCRGLGRMLNKFPHLSGTLRLDQRGAFSIETPPAPQAGILFHYADLTGDCTFPSFRELQAASFPFADGNSDGLSKLRPDPYPAHEDGDGAPTFIPQLTHVRGGLVLLMCWSHMCGDMVLANAILDTWAQETYEVAAAAAEGRPEAPVPEPVARSLNDRSRLLPRHDGPATFAELAKPAQAFSDWKLVDPTDVVTLETMQSIVPPPYIPASQAHATKELRTTLSGVWRFPLASLEALHSAVQAASKTGTKLSTANVLTAYLWERVFKAKYQPQASGGHTPLHSEIVFAGDIRRRLDPPLPADYMGAAVDLLRCSATTDSLTARSTDPHNFSHLAEIATALRTSNDNWKEKDYMAMLSLSQRTPMSPGFMPRGPIDLLCTDHSRIPSVRTNSWGPTLGSPIAYREPYLGREPPAGEVTVLPRCENGDLEVMISAEKVVMGRLLEDGDLGRWGERQFVMHDVVEEKRRRDTRARL
jgi:hypothetical protein